MLEMARCSHCHGASPFRSDPASLARLCWFQEHGAHLEAAWMQEQQATHRFSKVDDKRSLQMSTAEMNLILSGHFVARYVESLHFLARSFQFHCFFGCFLDGNYFGGSRFMYWYSGMCIQQARLQTGILDGRSPVPARNRISFRFKVLGLQALSWNLAPIHFPQQLAARKRVNCIQFAIRPPRSMPTHTDPHRPAPFDLDRSEAGRLGGRALPGAAGRRGGRGAEDHRLCGSVRGPDGGAPDASSDRWEEGGGERIGRRIGS